MFEESCRWMTNASLCNYFQFVPLFVIIFVDVPFNVNFPSIYST